MKESFNSNGVRTWVKDWAPVLQLCPMVTLVIVTIMYVSHTSKIAEKAGKTVTEAPFTERPYLEHYFARKDSQGRIIELPALELQEQDIEKEDSNLVFVVRNTYQTPAHNIEVYAIPYFIAQDGRLKEQLPGKFQTPRTPEPEYHVASFEEKPLPVMPDLRQYISKQKRLLEQGKEQELIEKSELEQRVKFQLVELKVWIRYNNAISPQNNPYPDPYDESRIYRITRGAR